MKDIKSNQSNQRSRALRLCITVGLAALFFTVLLCGLDSVSTSYADPGILYVESASGQDIPACGTTGSPCKTISYTLNSRASSGDTIRVAQGVYIENLGINISVTLEGGYEPTDWTRNITLHETIIDGSGAKFMRPVIDFFADSDGSTLEGFTVQNGDAYYYGGGIFIANEVDAVTVRNCTIISNTARLGGGGISIIGNMDSTITGCTIMNNIADMGGGLYIAEALTVTIGNSLIISNTAIAGEVELGRGGGIFVSDGSRGTIIGNEIISNTATGNGGGRGGGIFLGEADFTVQDNLVQSNNAYAGGGGIYVTWGADAIISNTQVLSNTTSHDFGGGILVCGGAKADIRDCLVANNRGAEWGGAGIVVDYYASATVAGNDIMSNTCPTNNDGGGGIRVNNHASAEISGNAITHNEAENGGGIAVTDYSTATITDNQILSNTATYGGGGIGVWESKVTIGHNVVNWNSARGASGLDINGATGDVYANTITYNRVGDWGSGGMSISGGSYVTVTNNVVASNTGTVMSWDGDGIAVWGDSTQARLINNTIVYNSAEGIQTDANSTVLMRNNVIVGNGGGIHDLDGEASVTLDHNDVWDNGWANYVNVITGTDDISKNPLFVDATNGDYHLQADSPCINAGTATGAPATDIEGTPRDAVPDIGAYEWGKYRVFLPLTLRNVGQ